MDTTDPDIYFDPEGQCSHCRRYDEQFAQTVEAAMSGDSIHRFEQMVSAIRSSGRGRNYDCVVGVSGGVDSTYVLLKAVEAGLRPLAVHFDSGWNSETAVNNIERATATLQVDLLTEVIRWPEMQDLQLSFFRAGVENCDIPTDHAFPAIALRSASRNGIKYILSGGNLATESVLPQAWGHNASDRRYLKAVHRAYGTVPLTTYPKLGIVRKEVWYRYLRRVVTLQPLNLIPYVKTEAKLEIASKLNWRDYGGKHYESVFTRFFQGYYLPTRFGFDKRVAHLSSLILSGQITRDQAILDLQRDDGYPPDLLQADKRFIAKKLGISPDELDDLISAPLELKRKYATNDRAYRLAFRLRELGGRA